MCSWHRGGTRDIRGPVVGAGSRFKQTALGESMWGSLVNVIRTGAPVFYFIFLWLEHDAYFLGAKMEKGTTVIELSETHKKTKSDTFFLRASRRKL